MSRHRGRGRCLPESSEGFGSTVREGLYRPNMQGQWLRGPRAQHPCSHAGRPRLPPSVPALPAFAAGAQSQRPPHRRPRTWGQACGRLQSLSGVWGELGWALSLGTLLDSLWFLTPSFLGLPVSQPFVFSSQLKLVFRCSPPSRWRGISFLKIKGQLFSHVWAGRVPGGSWGWRLAGGTALRCPPGQSGLFKTWS